MEVRLRRIYLVRHGETVWNRDGRMQGHTDVSLSPVGEEQARRLAERLAGEKIDAVWSSDLCRASLTAEMLAAPHALTVRISPLLRESMLGNWEGKTEAEICAGGEGEQWLAYRRDAIA